MYPERLPQRRWFEHYATLFDTVEINDTFYRLPPPETTEGWAEQAPTGFSYALKLGQFGLQPRGDGVQKPWSQRSLNLDAVVSPGEDAHGRSVCKGAPAPNA